MTRAVPSAIVVAVRVWPLSASSHSSTAPESGPPVTGSFTHTRVSPSDDWT